MTKKEGNMKKLYYVYIITNKRRGVLYIGFTSVLPGRSWQHRNKVVKSFSARYNLEKLVYYEVFDDRNRP